MKYTIKNKILVTLSEQDFRLLPRTDAELPRLAWIREAIREKAERERLDKMYAKMNKGIAKELLK